MVPGRNRGISTTSAVNPDQHVVRRPCLALSADGNEAYWTFQPPGGHGGDDIWTSRRVDGKWTAAENLRPNVNGPGGEHHSIPTPDRRALYVTSNRAGGLSGEDIYFSTREPIGHRGRLVNAGPSVNGPGSDRWVPFKAIHPDTESASALGAPCS